MLISHAIVLGITQGITEFLPISSSAHLVILPLFLKNSYQGLTFDVGLHIGTLFAIIIYFYKEWLSMIKKAFIQPKSQEATLLWFLVAANIPAAIIGYWLEKSAVTILRNPLIISSALIIGALILWLADKKHSLLNSISDIGLKEIMLIGFAQCLALIPGFSRSGMTIAAGLFVGLKREEAARFSFLLSAPIIMGAGLLEIKKASAAELNVPLFIGIAGSMISAILSISFLLNYLKKANLNIFVIYRIILGLAIILLVARGFVSI